MDVTNCDTGTVGAPDQLFLCGVTEIKAAKKYKANVGSGVTYEYDDETISNFTEEELKLSPTAYTPSGAATPLLGDVNGDGDVDLYDLLTLQQYLAKNITLTEAQLLISDVTKDDKVDLYDLLTLQQYLAHNITSLEQ